MKLEISSIDVSYGHIPIIHSLTFSMAAGEVVAVIGPNGSGKSTFVKAIAGINPPVFGSITLNDYDLTQIPSYRMAKMVGYVPQDFLQLASITVLDTILLGRRPHVSWSLTETDFHIVDEAMKRLNIQSLAEKRLDKVSGGERQKVFIARAIAQQPLLYLFDEPTSALDIRHQIDVFRLIRELAHKSRAAVIVVCHDLNFAHNYADRILLMENGVVVADGTPESVINREIIQEVYKVEMQRVKTDRGTYVVPVWDSVKNGK